MWNFSSPIQRNLPRSVGRTHGVTVARATWEIVSSRVPVVAGATETLAAWAALRDGAGTQESRCSRMRAILSARRNFISSRGRAVFFRSWGNMPIPSSLYDFFQRRIPRLPAKNLSCLRRIGDEFRRVARPPLRFLNRDSASTNALHCGNYFANGVTAARAKINGSILVTLEHVPESCKVRLGQVHDMRIVADC